MPGFNISRDNDWGHSPSPREDPLRTYRWLLHTIKFGGSLYNVTKPEHESLRGFVSMDLPSISIDPLKIPGLSIDYQFAKKVSFGDVKLSFYAYPSLQNLLEAWFDRVWNVREGLIATSYKGYVKLHELDHSGKKIDEFTLANAWPKAMDADSLTMEGGGLKKVNVSFAYDWYIYKNEKIKSRNQETLAERAAQDTSATMSGNVRQRPPTNVSTSELPGSSGGAFT